MQLKFTSLVLLATLATNTLACHHPKPNHDVTCKLSFNRGKLSSNGTHIIIQGTTTQATKCKDLTKEKREEAKIPEILPGGSVVHVFTKDSTKIKDANGNVHHGNDCLVAIPDVLLPDFNKKETVKLVIPIDQKTQIDCERLIPKSSQTKSKSIPTPTGTPSDSNPVKQKPTPKPEDEEKKQKEKEQKEKEQKEKEQKEKEEKERKEREKEEERKEREEKERKEKEEKEKEEKEKDDEDDDEEKKNNGGGVTKWLFDDGMVTFFTPNQGACGDWNDDNDMIAAVGEDFYGDMDEESDLCGKKLEIEGPRGNKIIVTVKDACPPCDADHVDLSPAAFRKLGEFDTGILKVKWRILN